MQTHPYRPGSWLVQDEESGLIRYAEDLTLDFRGRYITRPYADSEHPQDFIKPLDDPAPLPYYNPVYPIQDVCNFLAIYVGNTTIYTQRDGPAEHLFDPGIDEMEIGCSFVVRPNQPYFWET